jgi:Ca2+-binding EF-hand superfamily protein
MEQYDKDKKGSIDFVQFCEMGEGLWKAADGLQEKKCDVAFNKAKEVFDKLFEWLDRDGDGSIGPEDMMYGISRMMIRDADLGEIEKVFAKYDTEKSGKLNKEKFNLAVVNGLLDNSFGDANFKETFIK